METVKIRLAKSQDLERIKEIFLAAATDETKSQFPKKSKKDIKTETQGELKNIFKNFKKELKSKNSRWLVAEINLKFVGFANAEIKRKDEGWLAFNYIEKNYRSKGIGKKLTKERINWLKKRKIKYLCATALIKNKKSVNNLRNFGLEPTSFKLQKEIKY
ncbi:MAG: GNAT family N-acetyltransferase [Nanoarchaeota archaeon]|jgi:GNAT superfamily N-acetyltransferase|nr:GNAT family N-acetyltransferase [Nanoarchaeota archaeon]